MDGELQAEARHRVRVRARVVAVTNYSRGAAFERQVVDWFTVRGYVSGRAAGSHGHADVWALRADHDPVLVQVKIHGYMSPKERLDLLTTAEKAGAVPLLADRPERGTLRIRRLHSSGDGYDAWP